MNGDRQGILSGRDFIDIDVCYCDRTWLAKSQDNGDVDEGSLNRSEKRPADAGLFSNSGDCWSITPYLLHCSACHTVKYGRRRWVVPSHLKQLSSPTESIPHWEQGRSWTLSDTPNLTGVERKK